MKFVWHNYYITIFAICKYFYKIYPITFRAVKKAFLREEGGTRSVTEGACVN